MAMPKIIKDLATQIGILYTPEQNSIYSIKDDYPIQFFESSDRNATSLIGVIRFDDGNKDRLVKDTILQDKNIQNTGLKPKTVDVTNGIISLKWLKGVTGYPKLEKIIEQFMSVLNAIKPMVSGPGLKCRMCGSKDINGPILIDGLVDRICTQCIENLQKQAAQVKAAYEALPTNYVLAIITASVLALIGAAVWSGILISTQTMYWMIAILIGVGIGWCTTKAAGKGGTAVQIIVFSSTVISVLLGMIFYIGFIIQTEASEAGEFINWGEFILNIPYFLMQIKEDVAFSLGGGLIGAFFAASKAGKPKLEIKVEK